MTTTFNLIGTTVVALAACLVAGWTGLLVLAVLVGALGVTRS